MFRLKRIPQTEEFQDNLKLFVSEWRDQTKKEVKDLQVLKDRVAIRRVSRYHYHRCQGNKRFSLLSRQQMIFVVVKATKDTDYLFLQAQRAEEDEKLREMHEREEALRIQEIEDTKIRKQQEKLKRIEDAEKKRQKLIEQEQTKRNFTIQVFIS
jgi:hypothetical protein